MLRQAMVLVAAFSLTLPSMAISAPPTRAQKVAEAKASLEEMADEVAIKLWTEKRDIMDKYGVTMDYNRRFGRWLGAAFSLGLCDSYVSPTLIADWMSKMDNLSLSLSMDGIELRRVIEATGNKLRENGKAFRAEVNPSAASCSIELEAVRQFIAAI